MFITQCDGKFEIRERRYDRSADGKPVRLERLIFVCDTFAMAKVQLLKINNYIRQGGVIA